MKKRFVVVPVLVSTLAASGGATLKIKSLEAENAKLQKEIEETVKEEPLVSYSKTVEDIREINEENIDLIVYESDYTNYALESKDERFLGIDSRANADFKYTVTIDLSKREITQVGDKILVHISQEDIVLKDISIERPNVNYDTNIMTSFYGNRIIETEKSMLKELYDGIDREVHKNFKLNKEKFKLNLIQKLDELYDSDNVHVVFE